MAKDFIKEKNKPKGTKVTRLPQFVEDARFKSYFDGFYPMLKEEFGKDKGFIDTSTSENQDLGKVATTQAKAAQIMLDKLGANYTKTVYFLEDHKTPIKIEDPEEDGKFFAESTYVVDLQSNTHRYQLCWQGKKLTSEENSHTLEAMEIISNHINTSDMTRIRVRKGHEDESFLKFFPTGFVILDEARIPMAEWNAKMADKGVMLRV